MNDDRRRVGEGREHLVNANLRSLEGRTQFAKIGDLSICTRQSASIRQRVSFCLIDLSLLLFLSLSLPPRPFPPPSLRLAKSGLEDD